MNPKITARLYSLLIARVTELNARELCEQLKLELHNEVKDLPWKDAAEVLDLKTQLEARIIMSKVLEERTVLISQFRQELIKAAGEVFHDA